MTAEPQGPLLLACALGAEQWALRPAGRLPGVRLLRTGMGARRAGHSVSAALRQGAYAPRAFLYAGFGAAVGPGPCSGDLVVATEVRDTLGEPVGLPGGRQLADALVRSGLGVHSGPLYTADRIVRGEQRTALHTDGVLCVDMETAAALRALPPGVPVAAVRVIVDTPERELLRPGTLVHGVRAWRVLRAAAPVLAGWRP
ncbi:1-hydroxy-2-methyl-2-butenyl 4-diphosphate reductase [Streptacidiphilus sp. P02-A3a]|uniref:phosphorylase family protein n=1 Tax=Streptacidiphilus sp. P02-A3a TaxID=2704468 RepID=UPI0015FE40B5|nr:1-hydroxy-2-methyl-2-butenyl 4-diphosphate reductase [Streptacidiphilus sp. P02-A3a]QMU69264.1 1-hydroxy-2-methyl-2-butenyl 4-diphosphate reductase [Streptacidiphilus sp. P02-A3a]